MTTDKDREPEDAETEASEDAADDAVSDHDDGAEPESADDEGDEPAETDDDDDDADAASADGDAASDDNADAKKADAKKADAKKADAEPAPAAPPGPPRQSRLIQVGVVTALVVIADLWSKAWAWGRLKEGDPITVIDNWFYFEFGFNTGSAFSLGRDAGWARMAFIAVTILALLYMARLAMTLPTRFGVAFVSVSMVAGGAIGNLHDRLFRLMEIRGEVRHGVVDFIKVFYWPGKVWPTFNIADVALVVGVGLLLVFLTRHGDALDAEIAAAKKNK